MEIYWILCRKDVIMGLPPTSTLHWASLPCQPQSGCHSKVTSLQALLRKAFRSPGVLVLGDFGFSAYFFLALRARKNKPKILTCFA